MTPRPVLPWLLTAGGALVVGAGVWAVIAWRPAPTPVTQASVIVPPPAPVPVPIPAPGPGPPQSIAPATPSPQAALAPPGPAAPSPPVPAVLAPSFDIVRVSPQGSAVIAGRAEPGSEITVFDGTRAVARTRADRRGEFVALPAAPLPEGGRELTLASRNADGPERRSDGTVLVVVPPLPAPVLALPSPAAATPAPTPAPGPVAVLVPSVGAPRVLQEQRRVTPISLDVVDYTEGGGIRFTGAAAPNAVLRLYVDNGVVGDIRADAAGRWMLAPGATVAPGMHTLRVDELDAAGRVIARIELPFQRATPVVAENTSRVIVQPGQSLWRLARAAYGSGMRYTTIYLANREQIRNPSLIYPGQAFTVPTQAP